MTTIASATGAQDPGFSPSLAVDSGSAFMRTTPGPADSAIGEPAAVETAAIRGLPMPDLDVSTSSKPVTTFYATTIDDRGRIGTRSPLSDMHWAPGHEVTFRLDGGTVVVVGTPSGHRIGSRGHLRIPAGLRHRCRLEPGARVLIVPVPSRGLIEIYPASAVEAVLERSRRSRL